MNEQIIHTAIIKDYFTLEMLLRKLGCPYSEYPRALLGELLENAVDTIEPNPQKSVSIYTGKKYLAVFDNGKGIPQELVEKFYDFNTRYSSKAHILTPSRGKQGEGLKVVIGMCTVFNATLIWHTAEHKKIEIRLNRDKLEVGKIQYEIYDHGHTDWTGVEITGLPIFDNRSHIKISQYIFLCSVANPDVKISHINVDHKDSCVVYKPSMPAKNRRSVSCIGFYNFVSYRKLLLHMKENDVYCNVRYKKFISDFFGRRVSDESDIKCSVSALDLDSEAFKQDFYKLRDSQSKKWGTLLSDHLIGFSANKFFVSPDDGTPYLVEMSVNKASGNFLNPILLNNGVCFYSAESIRFVPTDLRVGGKNFRSANCLQTIINEFHDYQFSIHIICPNPAFLSTAKHMFQIDAILSEFMKMLSTQINRARTNSQTHGSHTSIKDQMLAYMDKAYDAATTPEHPYITARQLYYKLRELMHLSESSSTYTTFTQDALTEWFELNPTKEPYVNFAERGNVFTDEFKFLLGSEDVDTFISRNKQHRNKLTITSATDKHDVRLDFDVKYQNCNVLYIEKRGFDGIFRAEEFSRKNNTIIISGQGYCTRAAKILMYYLQEQCHCHIFCMHDLDIAGVNIYNNLCTPNKKFKHQIKALDLGISIEDVKQYSITPETVQLKKGQNANNMLASFTKEQQRFFYVNDHCVRRVELNAFTSAQLFEIMENKLKCFRSLPKISPSEVIQIDQDAVKMQAVMQYLVKHYDILNQMPDFHVDMPDTAMTLPQLMRFVPDWQDQMRDAAEQVLPDVFKNLKLKLPDWFF